MANWCGEIYLSGRGREGRALARKLALACSVLLLASGLVVGHALVPWPAERLEDAETLFSQGPGSLRVPGNADGWQENWSGAHWNPETGVLWLCRNAPGEIRAFEFDGGLWSFLGGTEVDGDLEGITQRSFSDSAVFVLAENDQRIDEYDVGVSPAALIRSWDIADLVIADSGLEGLVFVPDAVLSAQGFVDGSGEPYPESRFGFGGVFLLSFQETGDIFALDLGVDAQEAHYEHIGTYSLPLADTRGLELDRTTGILYAIDGDDFAALWLSSTDSAFDVLYHAKSPGPEAVEGLALSPAAAEEHWAIVTNDEPEASPAVVLYEEFEPVCTSGNC